MLVFDVVVRIKVNDEFIGGEGHLSEEVRLCFVHVLRILNVGEFLD